MCSISIIIPVYNVERYIERCILSVMNQKYYDGEIECIVVDDCSPDRSIFIAQELIYNYSGPIQFHILHNPDNQGLSCSRNNGLRRAKGEYVFFLDSDDYISDDCLHCLSRVLNLHNGVVDVVIGNSYNPRDGKYLQKRDGGPLIFHEHIDIMRRFFQVQIPAMAWNKLIRRDFILKHDLYFKPHMLHEDELWSFQLYDVVNNVVVIPEVTYFYVLNSNSIMSSRANLDSRVEANQFLIQWMLNSLNKKELYVEKFFWGINRYMIADDLISNNSLSDNLTLMNKTLRNQMFNRSLKDRRWSITAFMLLTLMPPCCYLVRQSWFRHKYHIILKLFRKVAMLFNTVH